MKNRTYNKLIEYVNGRNFRYKLYRGWPGKLMADDNRVDPTNAILFVLRDNRDKYSYSQFMTWLDKLPCSDLYSQKLNNAFKHLGGNVYDSYIDYIYKI